MGGNWILLFEAYNYTSISIATLSYYFAPVIVMIVCPIIFKEKLTLKEKKRQKIKIKKERPAIISQVVLKKKKK